MISTARSEIGSALGTSSQQNIVSAVVEGNDNSGNITFTTGDNPSNGELARILFSEPYNGSTPNVSLQPTNSDSAKLQVYIEKIEQGNKVIGYKVLTNIPPQPNKVYTFDYVVIASGE